MPKHLEPNTRLVILNGAGGCGKDTFILLMGRYVNVHSESAINPVIPIAKAMDWDGEKTEEGRALLSELKFAWSKYNDGPFRRTCAWIETMGHVRELAEVNSPVILFLVIREPSEIRKFVQEYPDAHTVLIRHPNQVEWHNPADANVENYLYDTIIENSGTKEDLAQDAQALFAKLFPRTAPSPK